MGSQRVRHDWVTFTLHSHNCLLLYAIWRYLEAMWYLMYSNSLPQIILLCTHSLYKMESIDCKVKVTQSCLTLCDPMDYTVHGILQARIPQWIAVPFSRGSSQARDWTGLPRCGQILYQLSHLGSPWEYKANANIYTYIYIKQCSYNRS